MPATRPRPRVGDRSWFVEWTSEIPVDENGDRDIDAAVSHQRRFPTEADAAAFAAEIYPRDAFGAVAYWESEFVAYDPDDAARYPHAGFWECLADAKHYEGPDE